MVRKKHRTEKYELQILESGQKCDDAFEICEKMENHGKYFKLEKLQEKLPIADEDLNDFIKFRWDLTGLIEMPHVKGTQCGTCFVQKIERFSERHCPYPECLKCEEAKSWGKVTVSTAHHVIGEEMDAKMCTIRLFYDSDDSENNEKKLHGLESHSRDKEGDWCALDCVTHDPELLDSLEEKLGQHWKLGRKLKKKYQDSDLNLVVVLSHPHGGPKLLSVGEGRRRDLAREVSDEQHWCYHSYDAATCAGSSGGPVYVLGEWNDGFGYWFGHAHNHSGVNEEALNSSTVGVKSMIQ